MANLKRIERFQKGIELFGYDFMIDEDLRVWLIEVNSSPALAMDGAAD